MSNFAFKTLLKFNRDEQTAVINEAVKIYSDVFSPEWGSTLKRFFVGFLLVCVAAVFIVIAINANRIIVIIPSVLLVSIGLSVISWAIISRKLKQRNVRKTVELCKTALSELLNTFAENSDVDFRLREFIQITAPDTNFLRRYSFHEYRAFVYDGSATFLFADGFAISLTRKNCENADFNSLINFLKIDSHNCIFAAKDANGKYYI